VGANPGCLRTLREQTFGRPPKGIWLPECAYYEARANASGCGLRFLTDGHGILYARPRPTLAAMPFLLKPVLPFFEIRIFSASVVF